MNDTRVREGLALGTLVTVNTEQLKGVIAQRDQWQQRAEAAETELAETKSGLAHTQAGLTIWMERSKSNARELDEAYDAMCEMAKTLDCAEDWPAIKAKLAERDALLGKMREQLA